MSLLRDVFGRALDRQAYFSQPIINQLAVQFKVTGFEWFIIQSIFGIWNNGAGAVPAQPFVNMGHGGVSEWDAAAQVAIAAGSNAAITFGLGLTTMTADVPVATYALPEVVNEGDCIVTVGTTGGDGGTMVGGVCMVVLGKLYRNNRPG